MRIAVAALLVLIGITAFAAGDESPYGFSGMEIYKLDWQMRRLTPADLDGDGLTDLLVANNNKAKIEVLLRRKDPVPLVTKSGEKLPNVLADDRFFEKREILTEKEVFSIVASDLNSDGKVDVAYFGRPEELVVAYGDGKGGFPRSARFATDDAALLLRGLAAGDLNGDGRTDLVLVGKRSTSIYTQTEKGTLAEPMKLPHSDEGVVAVQVVDVDGDGRLDLVHLIPNSKRSIRIRFQVTDGTLGPVVAMETTPWRLGSFADFDGKPGAELAVVQRSSGVLRILSVAPNADSAEQPLGLGNPLLYAFEKSSGKKPRTVAVGDVNGDGRKDVVVTEPDTAQVALYLQGADGRLSGRRVFPSLSKTEAVHVVDLDGDKRAEIIVLSTGEKAVGMSSLSPEGRLPFPSMLDLPGKPVVLDTGDVDGDGRHDLVVIVERKDKTRAAIIQRSAGARMEVPLAGVKSGPDAVLVMDFDHDGRSDLVLLDRFGAARIWRGSEDKDAGVRFDPVATPSSRSGMLYRLDPASVTLSDVDGDGKREMLVASQNFARALRLDKSGAPEVVDQANGRSPSSDIKGAVAADFDGDGKPDVALYDRSDNKVTLLQRDATGVLKVVGSIEVGSMAFRGMLAADMNGDGRADLLLAGKARFAILYAGGQSRELIERHTYERDEEYASLGYSALGKLGGASGVDLAIIDNGTRSMAILSYDPEKGFREQMAWRVYEKKMHEDGKRGGGAREVVVADFTGDGRDDVAILVHDRLIIYPQ